MRRLTPAILVSAVLAAVALPACQGPNTSPTAATDADRAVKPDRLRDVPPPPGLDPQAVQPRRGEALVKAQLTLPQVLAVLPTPDYLTPTAAQLASRPDARTNAGPAADDAGVNSGGAAVDLDRVPLAAQRAYLKARQAWREGGSFEAVRLLQQALRLAPDSAAILRLLGRIDTAGGNAVRGAQYLEQAVRLEPNDPQSLFMLARYAAFQGKSGDAITVMARAIELARNEADQDPALPPLMQFHLGSSLERSGYDAAAIAAYLHALDLPDSFPRSTGLLRELAFLYRQRGDTWLSIGDAHHRLGSPRAARLAYQKAADYEVNTADLAARLAYTLLRLGHDDDAQGIVAQALQSQGATDPVLALLRYTVAHSRAAGPLLDQLRAAYVARGRPAQIALALADVLPPDQAFNLLAEHLAQRPTDQSVFVRWLALCDDQAADSVLVIRSTAAFIGHAPQTGIPYSDLLAGHLMDRDDDQVTAAWEAIRYEPHKHDAVGLAVFRPWFNLLQATWLAGRGRNAQAIDLLQQTLSESSPSDLPLLLPLKLRLGELLVRAERFEDASALVESLADSDDDMAVRLRVRVLAQTGHPDQALRLLDGLLAAEPGNLTLVLDKANLHLQTGDSAAAERTLLDAINASPNQERLYEALIDLYDSPAAPPDAIRQYQRLMARLLRSMPESRVARVERAKLHAARGEVAAAEELLRQVLKEKPEDFRALDALLDALAHADRKPQADALIRDHLDARPTDHRLLLLARQYYQRTNNRPGFEDATLRLLLLQPESADRALALAAFYAQTGRFEEGERHLRDAMPRYPEHEADLGYQRAMLLERQGRRDESEKVMLDVLSRHPDHAMVNNALGYAWADRGRNLDQAQAMIRKAVEADPNNAAYLDSLGWVLYKRGDFAQAQVWLQRSQAAAQGQYPVILDHLGDAQYRLDHKDEARKSWQQALGLLQRLRQTGQDDDAELTGLDERLAAKLKALDENQPAPVAAVP